MTDREDLEQEALQAVCTCDYYELADCIDGATDEELRAVIADPCAHHRSEGFDCEGNELEDTTAAFDAFMGYPKQLVDGLMDDWATFKRGTEGPDNTTAHQHTWEIVTGEDGDRVRQCRDCRTWENIATDVPTPAQQSMEQPF